jgi:hypothetical protein
MEYLTITDTKADGTKEFWGCSYTFTGDFSKAIKVLSPKVANAELKKAKQHGEDRNLSVESHLTNPKVVA